MPQIKSFFFRSLALLAMISCTCAPLFSADAPAPAETAPAVQTAPGFDATPARASGEIPTKVKDAVEKTAADTGDAPSATLPADPGATANAVPLTSGSASQPAKIPPSQNVTINLINRLVQRGVLSKEDADELIKQAEADAASARAQAEADAGAAAQAAVAQVAASQLPPPPSDDSVRVTYIPEMVKAQMRDQIKQEVMDQAREENWAAPRTLPEWTMRFRFFGDLRFRYEGDFYPAGNDVNGDFPNFNAINTGSPYDVSAGNPIPPPQYNVDQNRNRFRLRARLGTEMDLGEGFTAGMRLATGENNSPVTANQSFGYANSAQGGDFSKYSIWLDRAFLKYELGGEADKKLAVTVGRFDNPFFSTRIIWADDLGFDGAVVQGKYGFGGAVPFLTLGAFPVFNTDLNFGTNNATKFKSTDKWLDAIQAGVDWKINKDFSTKIGVAFYDFENIEGQLSSPFYPTYASQSANTDDTRPSFAQRGNTYMALRDIQPDAWNGNGTTNLYQYFGLATPFRDLALTGRVDFSHFDPFHISLIGEYIQNLAFNEGAINSLAVNNRGTNGKGPYSGGDTAWIVTLSLGKPAMEERWDWNINLGYRYVESDSVVDGFCDSDFGGGGTNLKGYTLGGNLALSKRVWLGLRWMSADSIAGPTYKNDVIQFDINAKF
jgi:hypothetical protein